MSQKSPQQEEMSQRIPSFVLDPVDLDNSLNNTLINLTDKIAVWEADRKDKKCRCSSLKTAIQSDLDKLKEEIQIQFSELTQLRFQTFHYERRLLLVLNKQTEHQTHHDKMMAEQRALLQNQINKLEALVDELRKNFPTKNSQAPTYADMIKSTTLPGVDSPPPVILIDSTDAKAKSATIRDKVKKLADEGTVDLRPKDVYLTQRNRVVLTMEDRGEAEKIAETLKSTLDKESFKISLPPPRRKRLNVLRVPTTITVDAIVEAIFYRLRRNPEYCQLAYEFPTKHGFRTLSLFTDAVTYYDLLRNPRLCVNFSAYQLTPYVRIIRCQKCQRFGHFARSCKAAEVCSKCSGPHRAETCNSSTSRCSNCHGANLRMDHPATSGLCSVFQEHRYALYEREWKQINAPPGLLPTL